MGGGAKIKSVQRGETLFGTTDLAVDVTIAAADLSRTFVLIDVRYAGETIGNNSMKHVQATLTSPTTLRLERSVANAAIKVAWQVIEFTGGVTVQQISSELADGVGTLAVAISPVDVDRTILVCSSRASSAGNNPTLDLTYKVNAVLTSETEVVFSRVGTSGAVHATAYVVEVRG